MKLSLQKLFIAPFAVGGKAPRSQRAWSRRAHLMLRHTALLIIGACLLVAGLAAGAFYFASRPTSLTFAVPGGNPEDVRLIQALTQQFARDRATVRLRPIIAATPQQSAAMIDSGKADLAIVRADLPMPKQGLAVAILRQNVAVLIVPAAGSPAKSTTKAAGKGAKAKAKKTEKIEKIEDLAGHRVGVIARPGGTNNLEVLNIILKQYEIAPEKLTIVGLDADNVGAAVRKNPVDVIFAVGPVSSKFIADAVAAASTPKDQPTFLAIGASEAIASHLPVYESTEIKEGVFGGKKPLPDDTVATIAFNHYIVARKGASDSEIGDFTRHLFGVRQGLAKEFPAIAKIEKPDTDKDATVQAHPGAAAYLDNDQKTFFDRYGDLLYWGLMVMSFFGAGVTWLTSYAKADDRVRRMHVIDHLLDVVKGARTAETVEELEKLRIDADAVLKKTLQQVEHNDLDEAALMAFSLALDQAQLAISDRRSMLTSRAMQATIETGSADTPENQKTSTEQASAEIAQLRMALKTAEQG